MKRRRIYLIRHGSVDYFHVDGTPLLPLTVPLNASGRQQADASNEGGGLLDGAEGQVAVQAFGVQPAL